MKFNYIIELLQKRIENRSSLCCSVEFSGRLKTVSSVATMSALHAETATTNERVSESGWDDDEYE